MTLTTRSHTTLLAALDDYALALASAGERFDQGRYIEAQVLAVHVRKLVHEGDTSRALLTEIGLRDVLTWVDTGGVPNPKTASSAACLTLMKVRSGLQRGGEYVPKLALYPPAPIRTRSGEHIDRGSRIPFEHWWTNPVIKDADGAEFSRQHRCSRSPTTLMTPSPARLARRWRRALRWGGCWRTAPGQRRRHRPPARFWPACVRSGSR
jgi:hypothetical protein